MARSAAEPIRRMAAVEACVQRFVGARLEWGKADCVKLAALSLRKQGVAVPLLKGVRYRSARAAYKRLREQGFETLLDAMDATGCARIAPASIWPGDIVGLPVAEDQPWGCALAVAAGNSRLISLDGAGAFAVVAPVPACPPLTAWRVSHG